jgi:peptidoglycan-N-acetylglucosamine deacetylase
MRTFRNSSRYLTLFVGCLLAVVGSGLVGFGAFALWARQQSTIDFYAAPTKAAVHHTAKPSSPKPSQPQASAPVSPPAPTQPKPDYLVPPVTDGIAPVLTTLPTNQPVVFLGIDDGGFKDASELQMMKDNHIRATLFLSRLFILNNPDFFKGFVPAGSLIENHTLSHNINMVDMSYDQMKAEICGMADYEEQTYGRRPILYRPPGGAYNLTMQQAAAACGMRAVVTWIAKANGGSMQYQIGNRLRPGDIVLMHFRPEFHQDMQAFLDAMHAAGLHTELLEDWLAPM